MSQTDDLVLENEEYVDRTIPEMTPVKARLDEIKINRRDWTPPVGHRDYEIDGATGQPKTIEIKKLEWWWVVEDTRDDGLYEGRRIKGESPPKMNTGDRNKTRTWASALLQREIGLGEQINLRDLTGMKGYITVVHEPDKKDPAIKWERIDDVIPITLFGSDDPPF